MTFREDSLETICQSLAERSATPGGGTAAAAVGAQGASLAAMVCRFSTRGEKYEAVAADMEAAADTFSGMADRLLDLAQEDSDAYDAVSAAFRMPKETDEEKTARKDAITAATVGAMDVPQRTLQLCATALDLLAQRADGANKNLASDLAVAARCLATGAEGGFGNVAINAEGMEGDPRAAEAMAAAHSSLDAARAAAAGITG